MGLQLTSLAYLWPAFAAASAGAAATALARGFAGVALGTPARRQKPSWIAPNRIALDLSTARLRDFSTGSAGPKALICAPFALHGATLVDFAEGHSLVTALAAGGLEQIFVTDWRSADPGMRFLSIDSYLADLNVLVDTIGPPVDLVGLCQGGWMALTYAARFPDKVGKLVLAGAPIDIAAGTSDLSRLATQTPLEVFRDLVELGEGRMLGSYALQVWEPPLLDAAAIRQVLQVPAGVEPGRSRRLASRFRVWHEWTLDLPGTYYLEVVERLFKQNQLAAGRFVALGQRIDLSKFTLPIFMLAARDDVVVAPAQINATAQLVGSPAHRMQTMVVPSEHLGLFMGSRTLTEAWPQIAHWLADRSTRA